mmetsp:Transcript_42011/g.48678  ORF Transcript_42011/g.48678 Transcript_42011/m.48678 type:complete len:180 (+) Transcript_42011:2952-3491(+)
MAMIIGHSESRNPTFGCNQVVIVRDQDTKHTLPVFLKQALCLTVYEAKGLEFDDVILYNFFDSSPAGNKWRILKDITMTTETRRKIKINEELTINELDSKQFDQKMKKLQKQAEDQEEDKTEEYTKLHVDQRNEILRDFSILCNELKHLYVSVTRPKVRLLIYDQDGKNRQAITQYWQD